MFDNVLQFVAEAQGVYAPFRWVGGPIAREWLQSRTGVVMAPGYRFYPTRGHLDRFNSYDAFLADCTDAYGVFVTGRKLWTQNVDQAQKYRKIILPDPRSGSFSHYADTVGEFPEMRVTVCRSTRNITQQYGATVLWYPQMIHNSIVFRDPGRVQGSAHMETVLPFSRSNMRPSVTVSKRHSEEFVSELWALFEKMEAQSQPPDEEFMAQMIDGPQ